MRPRCRANRELRERRVNRTRRDDAQSNHLLGRTLVNDDAKVDLGQLAERLEADVDDLDAWLHQELSYAERIGIHDVFNCDRCKKEGHGDIPATDR